MMFAGGSFAGELSERDIISYANKSMYENNDISAIELSKMYGPMDRRMLILPISGITWKDVIMKMPDSYIKSMSGYYGSRADREEIIDKIDSVYKTSKFETANTLVTRSNGYKFCLVDDGLREEFRSNKGFLRLFFGGLLPVYFEREDLFMFMRHHEVSHCLDDEVDYQSPEQKVISTMVHESAADLTATLVYANRYGTYDIFYKLIKPMRMANSMDVEHTTEDIVDHMIRDIDPGVLKGVEFSKIMKLRNVLLSNMETKEYLAIMIKNAYEKQMVSLYLRKKMLERGISQSKEVNSILDHNTDILNKLVTREIYRSIDIDNRFSSMIDASVDNLMHYKRNVNFDDGDIIKFKKYASTIGLQISPEVSLKLSNLK